MHQDKKAQDHEYYVRNREKIIAQVRAYSKQNKDKIATAKRGQYSRNREAILAKARQYYQRNMARIKQRTAGYQKVRKANDPVFNSAVLCRAALRSFLSGECKSNRVEELTGCTYDQHRAYLESKFAPGMSWDNYGTEWEIHHTNPIHWFDTRCPVERKQAFHYTNTEPVSKMDHRTKHKHRTRVTVSP